MGLDISSDAALEAKGPWDHGSVSANGARFHYVSRGSGPLILFLHGFPGYWWTWRHFIPEFANSGFQVISLDIRGYGLSDHTPRGYDPFTLSNDIAGTIRSFGHRDAIIVGHDVGGLLGWTTAALHPEVVRGLVAISAPHPLRMRQALLRERKQRKAASFMFKYQTPIFPERGLHAENSKEVEDFLVDRSSNQAWLNSEVVDHYRAAFDTPHTPHCALEFYRWQIRSLIRGDGRHYNEEMETHRVEPPVLHVEGAEDSIWLKSTVEGAEALTVGSYSYKELPGIGHFPHEENPQAVIKLIKDWLEERKFTD